MIKGASVNEPVGNITMAGLKLLEVPKSLTDGMGREQNSQYAGR